MTTPTDVTFVDNTTPVISAAWLNGVNDWTYGSYGVLGETFTATAFRTALGSAASGANTDITSLTNAVVVSPTGLSGYGVGAGGTVTQLTNKSTAVTLNKPTGQITMDAATLGANSSVNFQLTNSLITGADIVVCSVYNASVTSGANYRVSAAADGGAALIILENVSAGPLDEAVVINFAVINGSAS